ncbi:MAG TPA: DUF892 family protein [Candidatus Methylacidiphilales bacterium]
MNAPLQKAHVDQLQDLYRAEAQLVEALSTLAATATDPDLKKGFLAQRKRSREHAARLKKLCASLSRKTASGRAKAAEGLLALLASLKAEHRTVAEYTCAQTLARALGFERPDMPGIGIGMTFGAGAMPSRLRLCRE